MTPAPPELVALLAACRARPADDLPRLVLADWLDENGQPERAEFVRLQVEVSHPSADVERIRRLKRREAELLAEHENEWTSGYQQMAAVITPRYTPRENGRFATNLPAHRFVRGLMRITNATELTEQPELRAWLRSPELPWLEQIDLSFPSIGWFEKADFPDELYGRIGLTLRVGATPPADMRRQFRRLAMSGNFAFVRALSVLEVAGELALEAVTQGDVTHLVAVTAIGDEKQRAVAMVASAPFTALSSLNLGQITEEGIRTLAASPHLGNLTHLELALSPTGKGCPIGDGGMAVLCRSRLAESLRRVEFAYTGITDVGVAALAKSPLFANLHGERLNLNMNRIGDDGLKVLAESEHLLRFREIAFRSGDEPHQQNQIGDAGVEALAASPYAANLQYLDFWRNRITDRGAFALARSPHLNKVVDLSVKENAVTAAGAAALHERFGEKAKV